MHLVCRIGKDYAIRLPEPIVRALNLSEGDQVIVSVEGDAIVIRPLRRFFQRREYWSETSVEEIEHDSEELSRITEED